MGALTYEYLGNRDLRDAKVLLQSDSYSQAGRLAQQAVEKHLKYFIENNGSTEDYRLLSIHSTVKLYDRVAELNGVEFNNDDRKMMSVLKDYYDINYPGEECRELNPREAAEALEFAENFINKIKGGY